VFCLAADSSHLILRACDPQWLFNHKIKIIVSDDWREFGVLQSAVHEAWVYFMGGSRGGAVSYSTRNVADTFPWPRGRLPDAVGAAGHRFHEAREEFCRENNCGPIHAHNLMGDPEACGRSAETLRALYQDLAAAVWSCFEGDPDEVSFTFRGFGPRQRFYLTAESEKSIVARVVKLNRAISTA
jgi:hypothetical protein